MLTQLFPFLDPARSPADLARRLRALADDCAFLEFGCPIPAILQTAPLLEDWVSAVTAEGVRLIGHASGHPLHGGRMVMTTQLWFADPDGSWVRTLSRFSGSGHPLILTRSGASGRGW